MTRLRHLTRSLSWSAAYLVVQRWSSLFSGLLIIAAAIALPLLVPAVALWSGRSRHEIDFAVMALILLGTLAHTWTGLVTSALLAAGELRAVVHYKGSQLILAVVMLPLGGALGVSWLAAAMAVSMLIPAASFMRRASSEFSLHRVGLGGVEAAFASAAIAMPGLVAYQLLPARPGSLAALLVCLVATVLGVFLATRLTGVRSAVGSAAAVLQHRGIAA